jgi:hypothetical protein
VGADAFFFAMAGRAQVDDLLHVTPAALDFEELLVAQSDVLGGQLGSLVRSRYLPSRFSSGPTFAASVRLYSTGVQQRGRSGGPDRTSTDAPNYADRPVQALAPGYGSEGQ